MPPKQHQNSAAWLHSAFIEAVLRHAQCRHCGGYLQITGEDIEGSLETGCIDCNLPSPVLITGH